MKVAGSALSVAGHDVSRLNSVAGGAGGLEWERKGNKVMLMTMKEKRKVMGMVRERLFSEGTRSDGSRIHNATLQR